MLLPEFPAAPGLRLLLQTAHASLPCDHRACPGEAVGLLSLFAGGALTSASMQRRHLIPSHIGPQQTASIKVISLGASHLGSQYLLSDVCSSNGCPAGRRQHAAIGVPAVHLGASRCPLDCTHTLHAGRCLPTKRCSAALEATAWQAGATAVWQWQAARQQYGSGSRPHLSTGMAARVRAYSQSGWCRSTYIVHPLGLCA